MEVTKNSVKKLIAGIKNDELKREVIKKELKNGGLNEADVAEIIITDVEQNFGKYAELFKTNEDIRIIWGRFQDNPLYLARALVQIAPDIFYAYGFTYRIVIKLKGDLGPITIPPAPPRGDPKFSQYMESLPQAVSLSLRELDHTRTFREYLYVFSRDVEVGRQMIKNDIENAKTGYEGTLLADVLKYYAKLLAMQFPNFIPDIDGSLFPSVHVRWWLDLTSKVKRVLNMGDTGTQKTAYGVIASQMNTDGKILVLCAANAREQWKREIELYHRNKKELAIVVDSLKNARDIPRFEEKYIIVGYSTLDRDLENILKTQIKGLIWDECHYSKNASEEGGSNRGKATVELISKLPLETVLALSATPWESTPLEMAPVAWALRPDLFESPEAFIAQHPEDPRFLRELLSANVVEVLLEEVVDLPKITPNPWEDLFGARMIPMTSSQRKLYDIVRENGEDTKASQKVQRLLLACIHPHKLEDMYEWPEEFIESEVFKDPHLSAKLEWLQQMIPAELEDGSKIVIATGIFATGITRPVDDEDEDEFWIGEQLRQWYGDKVMILDGKTSKKKGKDGISECDRMIQQWRTDPNIRILVISIRAFPDSINLSVGALPGITKLIITTFSYPWVPWLQFAKGRFWRKGCGVPIFIQVPVLIDSMDEKLLNLVQRKWGKQLLYRAQVPLSEDEYRLLQKRINVHQLAAEAKSDREKMNQILGLVSGRGEADAKKVLEKEFGLSTNAETLARSFLKTQDKAASGHIVQFMKPFIKELLKQGVIHAEGVLDAGCGPLTCERKFDIPVFGIDMNHWMIQIGAEASPHKGKNARVGYISEMPEEWNGKFECIVSSMVLDWTSQRGHAGNISTRDAVMKRMIECCHPYGRVWWFVSENYLNDTLFETWKENLKAQGFKMIESLTGHVSSKDHRDKPFRFWSLCFSPCGQRFIPGVHSYLFCHEIERIKVKRGRRDHDPKLPVQKEGENLYAFEIEKPDGRVIDFRAASEQVGKDEVERLTKISDLKGWKFHTSPNLPWRVLEKLRERGIINVD